MEGFPVFTKIPVRFRDLDAKGHVNNAVYFTYWEIGRAHYFERVFGARTVEDTNFILATIRCDFVSQVSYGEDLEVGIRIPSVGRSSFDFEYELRASGGRPAARAWSTQVLFDYAAQRKIPIGEEWLAKVAAAEGQRPTRR
jgi:acyl-CoA thioester hydrolase